MPATVERPTHRWREFRFFIVLLQDWKQLASDHHENLLGHPWEFASWLEQREYADARQLRHIMLFLLFPEEFDRIATASHKRKIVRGFRRRWNESPEEFDYSDRIALDKEVLRIRKRLAADRGEPPEAIVFYAEPIESQWREKGSGIDAVEPETDWPDEKESERWLHKEHGDRSIWLISTGGGGRLWRDFREEGHVSIGWDYLGDLTEYASRDEMQALIAETEGRENPSNDSLAVWQFSREMEVGDLVIAKQGRSRLFGWGEVTGEYTFEPERGAHPHVRPVEWKAQGTWDLVGDQRGITTKTLTDFTPYPRWTRWALGVMDGEPREEHSEPKKGIYSLQEAVEELFLKPSEFSDILDSIGRRRNVILQGPPGVGKTFVARRLAYAFLGSEDLERVQMVQFHQSYSYEDFVQGWRPNEGGGFELRDGVFHAFCSRASSDPGNNYVFIIDEINRGNLSRIFGELMMLLESDKRGAKHAIPLAYSRDESFSVPENVYLVGLMNTADRSLALVDYALRRRFRFIDLEPAFGKERFEEYLLERGVSDGLVRRINDRMEELNGKIRSDHRNLGPGFEIGHSYFVPSDQDEALDETWYEGVIRGEIEPLLREYWFDRPEEVDKLLARLLP